MRSTLIQKLKKSNLTGRGGAAFPTWLKLKSVQNAKSNIKYVVCNAAEGEPEVAKDGFILEKHPARVIDGMKIIMNFLGAEKGIIYINQNYYKKFHKELKNFIHNSAIEFFIKPASAGYIGGEETAVLNIIEGKRAEPRLKPPFPVEYGLFGCPTFLSNVETFYSISLIYANKYKGQRFITINGDCPWHGVYEFNEKATINEILKSTENHPAFDFFVQVGGGRSGIVLNSSQLDIPVCGAGSITVYSLSKHKPNEILKRWIDFFACESCGQCVPCREGTYRLREIIYSKNPDWKLFKEILENLKESAFCGLGSTVPVPVISFMENVLPVWAKARILNA